MIQRENNISSKITSILLVSSCAETEIPLPLKQTTKSITFVNFVLFGEKDT